MKKTELVFVPSPGIGHILSTVEFAKHLLGRDERLAVTVLATRTPTAPAMGSYTQQLAASNPNIQFIDLPLVDPPSPKYTISPEKYLSVLMEKYKPHVKDAIISSVMSNSSTSLAGIVIDMFCTSMIDVAHELGVPSYVFFTSSAAFLAIMLHLPIHHSQIGTEFNFSDPDSDILGYASPVPTSVIPSFAFNKEGGHESLLEHAMRFKETKGIFINTFLELETNLIKSQQSEPETPPVYTVGPLLNLDGQQKFDPNREKIMKWLDDQPPSSVAFLCFGSMGYFDKSQLAQLAIALEQSDQRFLWSVRQPQSNIGEMPGEYANVAEALPEGFLQRTQNRGLVCGWAPQVEVLAHEAVGAFVSHCGWNSILESVWHGVPIVTWPMYAEQQINAFELVKELGLAAELTLDYRMENADKIVVMADKIEKAIRCVMDAENPIRQKAKEMAEISHKAMKDGGSSFVSIAHLIEDIIADKL